MPYSKWSEVNKALKGIKPKISLEQANLIASWADKTKGVDSPWAVSIANFKMAHHVEDGKWVRNKELETIEDDHLMKLFELAQALTSEETFEQVLAAIQGETAFLKTLLTEEDETIKAEDSDQDRERMIRSALNARFPRGDGVDIPSTGRPWIKETYKNYAIVEMGSKLYKVSYTIANGQATLGDLEEVVEKKRFVAAEEFCYFGPLQLAEAQTPDFAANRNADGTPKWIPLHRLGEWEHPLYGHLTMTDEKMEQAASNFLTCVHRPDSPIGAQVPVDTRHQGDAACGWLLEMRIAQSHLWGRVGWTDRGKEIVLDKQYRYVSPRYFDDPQHGPIFHEVTLTNRDFLKMPPLDGEGPNVVLSNDAQAIVISRMEDQEETMKIKLTIAGEEKELSLEEVQELVATGELTAKELAEAKVELEETKASQEETPQEAITLTRADGTQVVLSADVVVDLMHDNEVYRKDRRERDVRDVLTVLQEKNVEPIVAQMLQPILLSLNPEAKADFIQLEAGSVSKMFGFADEEGNAVAGQMNLFRALEAMIEQMPARSTDPRTLLPKSRRLKDSKPKAEGPYDPNAIDMEEIEQAEQEAARRYVELGKEPRIPVKEE